MQLVFESKPQQDQLMEAGWANSSGIERMTALAEPVIFFPWRPSAKRAADARRL
jgi:hypothetical protein